jgi:hypothetical protein
MAIIYSYPLKTTVKDTDQFVLSVAPTGGVGAFETNSITFETLKDSILTNVTSGTVTSVATTAPITGGTITSTGTIGITQATSSSDGYLSSADWTVFNAKQSTIEKGQANGYTPLNSSTKVDVQYLPDSFVGAVVYQGTWDASTNTPTLPAPDPNNKGYYYVVSVGGTYLGTPYGIGDWIISNGTAWEKVDNTQSVTSVNGLTGAVVLTTSEVSEGTNLYYTDSRVSANSSVVANSSKVSFPGFGTTAGTALEGDTVIPPAYTNADVDTHLNTSTASASQVLSWDGSDYDWITVSGGSTGVTQVNSGTGLTGGPIVNTGTLSLATAGVGAGTYGSDQNNTKIDEITVDAYGRITAITTGSTGAGDGTMSDWSIQDNAGTSTPITNNETFKIAQGTGISSTLTSVSPAILTLENTGVTSIIAGTGVSIDQGTGAVTITATGGGGGVTFDYTDSGTNLLIGESVTYTTQQGNVGLGEGALENQTASSYNTAIGYQSLQYSISGSGQNTALGYRALQGVTAVTDGYYNTAVGYEAGMRIESAQNNVFVGYQAGDQVTDGNTNVIIGSLAGGAITVHDDNVIIGSSAASALTGNKNVVIGKSAYTTASSTGDNNIVIGFNAEPSTNTVDNEITIGDANVNSLRLPGIQAGASDGDVLTYSSSSGNITLQPSSGGGGSGALTAFERVFTGSELVNAFNGNLTDQITLVSVPANNIIIIESFTTTILGSSTGTTNYNSNNTLYIKRDGQTAVSNNFNCASISSIVLNAGNDDFGVYLPMLTAGSYTRISPQWGGAGADLVLGPNTSNAVSITTGDRKLKISLTYRLVDVS